MPKGGPDGGDGGDGGDVYLEAREEVGSLDAFQYQRRYVAGDGEDGRGKGWRGRTGESLVVGVPVGTVVYEKRGEERHLLVDLSARGQRLLLARGGRGGRGNGRFVSASNRAPLLAEAGEKGEEVALVLELRLPVDVALIGAPNSGKSSLLSAVSGARPPVAPYPFTTRQPVLGAVRFGGEELVMAELPGLLEGAHRGVGLGNAFLRHAERSYIIINLVDGSSPDPLKECEEVGRELALYKEDLAVKPRVVAVNKIDLPEVRERVPRLVDDFAEKGVEVRFISAATGEGVEGLLLAVVQALRKARACAPAVPFLPPAPPRPRPREVREVVKEGEGVFRLCWPLAERLAARVDLEDRRVVVQLWRELRRMGAVKALEAEGVQSGDKVLLGKKALKWP